MNLTQDHAKDVAALRLRTRTRALHDQVDAIYSCFDLTQKSSYGDFLAAQYRATAAAEQALTAIPELPPWRPRSVLVAADLRELGRGLPAALCIGFSPSHAQAHGLLYVIEGSRLGGRLLVRNVPAGFPTSFLADGHQPGEWKRLLAAINHLGASRSDNIDQMMAGAEAGFRLFMAAAAITVPAEAR